MSLDECSVEGMNWDYSNLEELIKDFDASNDLSDPNILSDWSTQDILRFFEHRTSTIIQLRQFCKNDFDEEYASDIETKKDPFVSFSKVYYVLNNTIANYRGDDTPTPFVLHIFSNDDFDNLKQELMDLFHCIQDHGGFIAPKYSKDEIPISDLQRLYRILESGTIDFNPLDEEFLSDMIETWSYSPISVIQGHEVITNVEGRSTYQTVFYGFI